MVNYIKAIVSRLIMIGFRLFPLNNNKIVFKSDRGQQCTDSPLALFKAMKQLYPNFDYVWILTDTSHSIEGARVVKNGSIREIFELATSHIWLDNKRKGLWTTKRKNQIYVQTWHGPIALKKVEKDVEEKLQHYYVKSAKHDSKVCDYFLSSCKWATQFYRNSFWYDGEILELGIPRSDIFYQDSSSLKQEVYRFYGLENDTKLILYAPTFRKTDSLKYYDIDFNRLINHLSNRFKGKWKVILRLHPNLFKDQSRLHYTDDVLNGNQIDEITDLIVASEMLITDYSSCMFDAMEAGKLVMLYATDIDEYRNDRGFYFNLDELPFPISVNNDLLMKQINEFDFECYQKNVDLFKENLCLFNSSDSSVRISQFLIENS